MRNAKPVFWCLWVKGLNNGKSNIIGSVATGSGHPDYPGYLGHFLSRSK